MKSLSRYYAYVGIPIVLLAIAIAIFFEPIRGTVEGNPHPQINYIIFGLIVAGCCQMLAHVRRINMEGSIFGHYHEMVKQGIDSEEVNKILNDPNSPYDVAPLMQLIDGLRGKFLTRVQHAAIESEMERFAARQTRRLMMAQFMSGLMVGMGLLGTFIGLLGALAEIGKLIGSFDLGSGMTDPIATISLLVTRLTSPMQAMGVAFSASLFGVFGSLVMGFLMVGVRSASSDLVSLVHSEASLMIDITPQTDGIDPDRDEQGPSQTTSPLMAGWVLALDQSERRVRELIGALAGLLAHAENSNTAIHTLADQMTHQARQQQLLIRTVSAIEQSLNMLGEKQNLMADAVDRMVQMHQQQLKLIESAFEKQSQALGMQLQEQQSLWQGQASHQQKMLEMQLSQWQAQMQSERLSQQSFSERWLQQQSRSLEEMQAPMLMMQKLTEQVLQSLRNESQRHMQYQSLAAEQHREILETLRSSGVQAQREIQGRTEILSHIEALLRENQFRNEQLVQLLSQPVAGANGVRV